MKTFSQKLIVMICTFLGLGTCASALTFVVTYKPYGVPDSRREEYENKLAELDRLARLLKAEKASQGPAPKAVVSERVFDFGMINPHITAAHTFEIRNEGDETLALKIGGTSCKCTAGKLRDSLVQPGESTTVDVEWNTGYQSDLYKQSATLITNDPNAKKISLTVQGTVRAKFVGPRSIEFNRFDPLNPTESSFVVYSQLWNDFEVQVDSDLEDSVGNFDWYAEPISMSDATLADTEAKSAWRVRVFTTPTTDDVIDGEIRIVAIPNDGSEKVERSFPCTGRPKAQIAFISPNIHNTDGLDIGTLVAGQEYNFHLVVRARGRHRRDIQVLDVKPEELKASIVPMSKPGDYRLTIKVTEDCPMVVFNADQKHGYVQVGDVNDESFSNWFPVMGAVVPLD